MFVIDGIFLNPAGTILPGAGSSAKSNEDEIAEIERFVNTNREEYMANDRKQARLRELYDAKEQLAKRSA